ncbi:OprO/OprP family phosphate-selective porin [Telluribacter sp. SYSU D00476]|uniref:OprO/OprP family phosphate-selective porin n=1 Tax=Telluribacter sp. SYSU D00476 TaxID=2811430 RepID=UPI001FF3D8B5|nr:OprO/OprP family phosphate-selective porin [Telluribacter sp. SYSU D00476]
MKKIVFLVLALSSTAFAQNSPTEPAAAAPSNTDTRNDIRYNLNPSGTHYVKATFLNQTWLRLNNSNPGTTVLGDPRDETFDIGLRRTRMQLFGQLTDRVFFYTQFGMNNFNRLNAFPGYNNNGTPSNRKVAAFFHDALGEYEVHRKGTSFVRFGGGLTIMNGLSRFSQPGIGSILTMDVPVFAQVTVDQTDQFARKLSVYSRGQVGKLNYRIIVADPFPIETNGAVPPALGANSTFAQRNHRKQFSGLFIYNFFDTEDNTTPGYMTGTYLGRRKVLNLEAGFINQKNATWRREGADTTYSALNLWSVAAYLDMPINRVKGTAVSSYLGYFHTDYGRGYLRYNGLMNPASGTTQPLPGVGGTQGNAFPMFGTGNVVYAQAGYKFRDGLLGEQGTLLPYASLQHATYDRLQGGMNVWNLGVNWLMKGHTGKLSLNYENRPIYQASTTANLLAPSGRRGNWVLQYQVSI